MKYVQQQNDFYKNNVEQEDIKYSIWLQNWEAGKTNCIDQKCIERWHNYKERQKSDYHKSPG